jgi:predicted PurR-regulated permease PerM
VTVRPTDTRDELELFARKLALVVGVGLAGAVLWYARNVVVLVFIAAVLAAGIAPAVRRVRIMLRFLLKRRVPRGTAVMIVYLPFLVVVLVMLILVLPRLIGDMRALGAQLPALIEQNILTPLEKYVPLGAVREHLANGISVPRERVFGYVRGVATLIGSAVAVLFMVAYMLIDADRLRNLFLLIYRPEVRGRRRRTLMRIGSRMSSWLSGQLLLAAIIGVATFIVLAALRIPYALPLAMIAAIGEMVPVIGPTVGAIPALALALLHSRWQFWSVLLFAVILQKVENLFIVPRVMSSKVSVSPLAIFIAFMIGGTLLGIPGAIMAIPAAAIVQVAFEEAFVARRERRQDAERPGTLIRGAD